MSSLNNWTQTLANYYNTSLQQQQQQQKTETNNKQTTTNNIQKPFQQQPTLLKNPPPIFIANIENDAIMINDIIQHYANLLQNNINNSIPFLQIELVDYLISPRNWTTGIYLQNLNANGIGTCYLVSCFLFEKYIIAKMMEIIKRPYMWSYISSKQEIQQTENIIHKGFYQIQIVIFPY